MKKREEKEEEEEEVGSSLTGNLPQAAEYSGTSQVSITGVKGKIGGVLVPTWSAAGKCKERRRKKNKRIEKKKKTAKGGSKGGRGCTCGHTEKENTATWGRMESVAKRKKWGRLVGSLDVVAASCLGATL